MCNVHISGGKGKLSVGISQEGCQQLSKKNIPCSSPLPLPTYMQTSKLVQNG